MTAGRIASEVESLRASLSEGMADARMEVRYELRYRGQSFELPVDGADTTTTPEELAEAFAAEHERRYGYRDADGEVELVAIGVSLVDDAPTPVPAAAAGTTVESRRKVRFSGEWVDTLVIRGEPAAGTRVEGPAVLELPETTLALPPGWAADCDEHGTVVAEYGA